MTLTDPVSGNKYYQSTRKRRDGLGEQTMLVRNNYGGRKAMGLEKVMERELDRRYGNNFAAFSTAVMEILVALQARRGLEERMKQGGRV